MGDDLGRGNGAEGMSFVTVQICTVTIIYSCDNLEPGLRCWYMYMYKESRDMRVMPTRTYTDMLCM